MEKRRIFIINFLYFAIIAALTFIVLKFSLTLLFPFVAALVIAYALQRPIRFISTRSRLPQKLSAILIVLLFYGIIGTLLVLGSIRAFSYVSDLVQRLPQIYLLHISPVLTDLFRELEHALSQADPSVIDTLDYLAGQLMQSLRSLVSNLSLTSMEIISNIASSLPMLFIRMILMIISTFFIAMDYESLSSFCMRQLNERSRNVVMQIKQYVVGTLFVCIRSYALIMSITFVELSVGLTVIGIHNSILIAFCIAIFDILPVLGTGGIMIPWALISAILGDYPGAVKLALLYVLITIIRNIIEPKIVGGQIGLHPVVTLVSMFAGVQLFGVIGLFGFPIILSLISYLNRTGTIHLFRTAETEMPDCSKAKTDLPETKN